MCEYTTTTTTTTTTPVPLVAPSILLRARSARSSVLLPDYKSGGVNGHVV